MKKPQHKPITHYLQEEEVGEKHKEKVIFEIAQVARERNEEIERLEKEENPEMQEKIIKTVDELDKMISKKIQAIMKNEKHGDECTDCFSY